MRFNNSRNTFTCVCAHNGFNEQVVLDVLEWCRENARAFDYDLEATTTYCVHDIGEGLEEHSKVWTFKLFFARDDDTLAFRMALDGILAEATC